MDEKRRPTIKSIGQAAGVDPSTASRALRDEPGSRIPPATVERIRRAARDLGYEPNPWARSLRTRRTTLLGLAVPRLTDVVLAEVFEAAQQRARDHGYETISITGHEHVDGEQSSIRGLVERRVDGLILATATTDTTNLDQLTEAAIPFVLLNRSGGDYPVVRGDDELGGYLATRHLLEAGHRRIGHLAGPQYASTSSLRLAGYRRALEEFDVAFDPELLGYVSFDTHSALPVVDNLLETGRPTALFCVNDSVAIAALSCAQRRGLSVPGDLAVIGYNDMEIGALLTVPLSSVRMPLQRMGSQAVDMLFDVMAGKPVESVILKPELVIRASSSAAS